MEMVIEKEQPDLLVFCGDLIASAKDPIASFLKAVAVAEDYQTNWEAVFGNHNIEGNIPRKAMHT